MMRVLIVDYDFFTAIGGGQTLYRRIVERNPDTEFWYPSRGADVRESRKGNLPRNARPFPIDPNALAGCPLPVRPKGFADLTHSAALANIAMPIQGMIFDAIDVPSFLPCAHLVRPVFAAYGIVTGHVAHGLVGWPSVSVRNGYNDECTDEIADKWRISEEFSILASDVLYSIEGLYADDDSTMGQPLVNLTISDTLEDFPPPAETPPGEGPPDLWYVGRLDRTKGPDLFLDMVARLPRALYRHCYFTGPDNKAWAPGETWSQKLQNQAARLGLDAVFRGQISDAELRNEVYGGRSVVVVPSRSDVINYVALEALSSGCPILLSKHTGASEYLEKHHSEILPPIVDPEDSEASARALEALLKSYDSAARTLRQTIRVKPISNPEPGFMDAVYGTSAGDRTIAEDLSWPNPLLTPAAATWRPLAPADGMNVAAAVVIQVRDRPAHLAATLAAVTRQTARAREVIVVDDGTRDPAVIRTLVGQYPGVQLVRQGRQGPAWAANTGWRRAVQPIVAFLNAGDLPTPDYLATALESWPQGAECHVAVPRILSAPPSSFALARENASRSDRSGRDVNGLVVSRGALERLGGFDPDQEDAAAEQLVTGIRRIGSVRDLGGEAALIWRPWSLEFARNGAPPTPRASAEPAKQEEHT